MCSVFTRGALVANRQICICSKSSLPYIDALIQELLRWDIIGPLSLPHRLVQDDEYRGRTGCVYWDVVGANIVCMR